MDHFQDLISALVVDVKKIEQNNRALEERFEKYANLRLMIVTYLLASTKKCLFRERESHSAHLKNIEAELDAQMAKVEQQALAKAKQEFENERRDLQYKMDAELTELQTQLKLFQKVY